MKGEAGNRGKGGRLLGQAPACPGPSFSSARRPQAAGAAGLGLGPLRLRAFFQSRIKPKCLNHPSGRSIHLNPQFFKHSAFNPGNLHLGYAQHLGDTALSHIFKIAQKYHLALVPLQFAQVLLKHH